MFACSAPLQDEVRGNHSCHQFFPVLNDKNNILCVALFYVSPDCFRVWLCIVRE